MPALYRSALALFSFAATLGSAALASADLAPPPGFVETCTLEKQQSAGSECFSCAAYYGNHEHCPDSLAQYGFTQSCRSRGASVWSEVWCRKAAPSAAKVPPEILGQLQNSANKLPPAPPAVTPKPSLDPTPSAAPSAPPSPSLADPASTAVPPAPPPVPPQGGCMGCAIVRDKASAPVLSLGLVAFGIAALRRKRRLIR